MTLDDVRQFCRNYDRSAGDTRSQDQYDLIANDAARELFSAGKFDFSTRFTRFSLAEMYDTGTVDVTGGAITGHGTTFTSSMIGRYIRFNGENQQYRIGTYTNGTSIGCEAYLGAAGSLSGVSYQITDEKHAVPANFRSVQHILIDQPATYSGPLYRLKPMPFDQLTIGRMTYQSVDVPRFYAVEWAYHLDAGGNVAGYGVSPDAFIWVYPAPLAARIVTMFYNIWPPELTQADDEVPVPAEAERVYREFLLAGVFRKQRDLAAYQAQLAKAKSEAVATLGSSRSIDEPNVREEWCPEVDDDPSDVWVPKVVDPLPYT